ncbi:MAG TPA: hypothetical protein VGV59_17765 [Pyrinomonadaceae bacterium]|nr:hypothetical protein [Pyrinomonadaceae bacterium]
MNSVKCPHCGLLQFATAGNCKRCKKNIGVAADFTSGHKPTRGRQSSVRFQSAYPLASWLITLLLLTANVYLAYGVARKSAADDSEIVGMTIGGVIAWPLILLIVYGLSRKFRERYSLHAVINYGLGLNTIIQVFMSGR